MVSLKKRQSIEDAANYQSVLIAGKTYLPMDFIIGYGDDKKGKVLRQMGCIVQRIKKLKRGRLFKQGYGVVTLLVPEEKIHEAQSL